MKSIDLTGRKVLAVRDVRGARDEAATELIVASSCVITPSAQDFLAQQEMTLRRVEHGSPTLSKIDSHSPTSWRATHPRRADQKHPANELELFNSAEAEAIKNEICAVGKKLWARMYVDGNGGNISYRIGPNAVICTPTLVSKADLTPDDLCIVDLEGNQIAGHRPRTSEIFLHLEIYKAVPEAKAAVHCHPPHATAYAITGRVPPSRLVPEYEVFVGKVAVSPYETPGTKAFAETILPYVKKHNTVLLTNHGIVCWADTVTHAEWYAEVLETYCWTLLIASQLGAPLSFIPPEKAADLMKVKQRLGLPDPRFGMQECQLCDLPEPENPIALPPPPGSGGLGASSGDIEAIVRSVTDAVMSALEGKSNG